MKTQITNTGAARTLGYLPPHGKFLDNGEAELVDGDLRTVLGSGRNRYGRPTEIAALNADLAAGDIDYVEVAEEGSSSSA